MTKFLQRQNYKDNGVLRIKRIISVVKRIRDPTRNAESCISFWDGIRFALLLQKIWDIFGFFVNDRDW